jgi:hypothetical protein
MASSEYQENSENSQWELEGIIIGSSKLVAQGEGSGKYNVEISVKWKDIPYDGDNSVSSRKVVDLSLVQTSAERIAAHIFESEPDAMVFAHWASIEEGQDDEDPNFVLICKRLAHEFQYQYLWEEIVQEKEPVYLVVSRESRTRQPGIGIIQGFLDDVDEECCLFKKSEDQPSQRVKCLRIIRSSPWMDKLYSKKRTKKRKLTQEVLEENAEEQSTELADQNAEAGAMVEDVS